MIERALASEGPLTRHQLRERLRSAGLPTAGQALIHLIYRAALDGVCVRGPIIGREHAYVLVRDWLGGPKPVARERALAELARRYLLGHAPASDIDLARWAGLPLRDARAGLQSIASELRELPGGLVDLRGRRRAAAPPGPRLLGAFEPLLLGWSSRAAVLGDGEPLVISGGVFRAFALAGGRAVASWRFAANGRQIEIEPFAPLPAADAEAFGDDAQRVLRFFARSEAATQGRYQQP